MKIQFYVSGKIKEKFYRDAIRRVQQTFKPLL